MIAEVVMSQQVSSRASVLHVLSKLTLKPQRVADPPSRPREQLTPLAIGPIELIRRGALDDRDFRANTEQADHRFLEILRSKHRGAVQGEDFVTSRVLMIHRYSHTIPPARVRQRVGPLVLPVWPRRPRRRGR